jgi:hypothetical protein
VITGTTEAEDICWTWYPSIDLDGLLMGHAIRRIFSSGCGFAILILVIVEGCKSGLAVVLWSQVVVSWCMDGFSGDSSRAYPSPFIELLESPGIAQKKCAGNRSASFDLEKYPSPVPESTG